MRTLVHVLVVVFLLTVVAILGFMKEAGSAEKAIDHIALVFQDKSLDLKQKKLPEKRIADQKLEGDLFDWIGKKPEELVEKYGEPIRIDPSAYTYDWWVYTNEETHFIQFGVAEGEIITIYATGLDLEIAPFSIGDSYDLVDKELPFEQEVTYTSGPSSYTFQLTDEDLQHRPLAKVTSDLFIQTYFDSFTEQLSSIRIMKGDVLLQHHPYAMEYRGEIPSSPNPSEEKWADIEHGMEQQVFEISNVIRNYFNKSQLKWDDKVREVAYSHSRDMAENNYFSHYGLSGDGLKERLAENEVYYFAAGENIAAQYVDAPAAVQGWLNSEGHREALLNNKYTHLGVGVYRLYYTQNFLTKP
ncbi:Uncharacterized conserved protein YkwD, contains CAP (CSP/antigen 5/PR1) domain [Oceanobacillus limi]|uniref:Uncharacterized conserved protein YkwD, contains CAP (CSP/antigen 5/PR1) domain n=1 Tax=Oceanobacillus limi TaxID=930131 RepID=A0A1I0DE53_9BACI|nr:CAP domain-containing protein [Oceanobacillus limi]SET29848.1 Uncharacterized conserved protein YkwD, contains CAP (CSP/antigen 5/PR1) domain [Oceanobacillus limi]